MNNLCAATPVRSRSVTPPHQAGVLGHFKNRLPISFFCLSLIGALLASPNHASGQIPTITVGVTNQLLPIGGTLALGVVASGPSLSYLWFKDSRRLVGFTNSMFTVTNAGVINSGSYYVVITNSSGMAITRPALVAVGNPYLLSWGDNDYGQLGDTSDINIGSPNTQTGNVVAGAAGEGHSLFITADETLWAMGSDGVGQLGIGGGGSVMTPVNVASNVVAAAAGAGHSLFVKADGTLWAMGNNGDGQLGNGTTGIVSIPVCVASNVMAVAAGAEHSLFVTTDGILWAMGKNTYGELGNGTQVESDLPVGVASNVVSIAAGDQDSLFVKGDGTLWAMGYNHLGQLGSVDGGIVPVDVASNVVAVAAGGLHSLFITADQKLWAMGWNGYGQLGDSAPYGYTYQPVNVSSNVVAIAAGYYHSLFVKADGTLWAMGGDDFGQLGSGSLADADTPVNVPYLASVASVFPADQAQHSLAVGINYHAPVILGGLNQTYTGSAIGVVASTAPPGLKVTITYNGSLVVPTNGGSYTVVALISDPNYFGGATNTIVISTNATVTLSDLSQAFTGHAIRVTAATFPAGLAVNLTYNGSLAAPTNVGDYVVVGAVNDPVFRGGVTNILSIRPASPASETVATGGTVFLNIATGLKAPACQWFKNGRKLVGETNEALMLTNAAPSDSGSFNVELTSGSGICMSVPSLVAVGRPSLLAWGANFFGELGDGTTNEANSPVSVAENIVIGAAGEDQLLFITANGALWATGAIHAGESGPGGPSYTNLPTNVASDVVAAAAGPDDSFFVTTDGTLWAMGNNESGELGTGLTNSFEGAPISVASNAVAVAAGGAHSLFVTTDGTLWAAGGNFAGQLGDGTFNDTLLPINVASNVVVVAAGAFHSLFVTADGTLWAMGDNDNGELGDGTTDEAPSPITVASDVVAVAAGAYHSLFVTTDGTLWAMGWNGYGQLGDGTTNDAPFPISVASNVVSVAAGGQFSLFARTDGTVWAMGDNSYGELGNGTNAGIATLPVCVSHFSSVNVFPGSLAGHALALGFNSTNNNISLPHGLPMLTLVGTPDAGYNVERSSDLENWSVIWTTNEPANGVFQFIDPLAPSPNAFYRLQPSP